MRLGMDFPREWKLQSEKSGIALPDILYGYVIECLMLRIGRSRFHEFLWLINEECLGEDAYKKAIKDRLSFFYMESGRKTFGENVKAGHPLSREVVELFAREVLSDKTDDIAWIYHIEAKDTGYVLHIEASYLDMRVPVVVTIEAAPENAQSPKRKELKLVFVGKKSCPYLSYSKESILAESLFEMLKMLELVGDMECYSVANRILKIHSISGRHILEDMKVLGEKEPKVISMKRLEQMEDYKTYAYMKRKWEQYEKRHGREPEDWDEVTDRILAFLKPTWKALCENEIFFDDWMPGLGRFLG